LEDILNNCPNKPQILELYNNRIDQIDSLVGVLCEELVPGGFVGLTLFHSISQTFLKVRNGDRFWFENQFTGDELAEIK